MAAYTVSVGVECTEKEKIKEDKNYLKNIEITMLLAKYFQFSSFFVGKNFFKGNFYSSRQRKEKINVFIQY